jgi:predicted nucleic acid-binding protein
VRISPGDFMATTELTPKIVVCDAGPVIHLDEVNCLDLLSDFAEVIIPEAVWDEIANHRPAALDLKNVAFNRLAIHENLTPELATVFQVFSLHAGEQQAIQIAHELKSGLLLTDDSAARLAAQSLTIQVHGTIGVLLRAIRRHQRTKAEILDVLKSLPQTSTLHIKSSLLEEVIRSLNS